MSDIQDEREARWKRRRAVANRWSSIPAYLGVAALVGYMGLTISLPDQPDPTTGHIYRLYTGGRHATATYATDTERTIAIALFVFTVACVLASFIVYQSLNPGPLYREPSLDR